MYEDTKCYLQFTYADIYERFIWLDLDQANDVSEIGMSEVILNMFL